MVDWFEREREREKRIDKQKQNRHSYKQSSCFADALKSRLLAMVVM